MRVCVPWRSTYARSGASRVAMCRRINRTFAFPPSTVVPFYSLPHCLASHAAYRKHSLTCYVFFLFFFFFPRAFRSSNSSPLCLDVFYGVTANLCRNIRTWSEAYVSMLMIRWWTNGQPWNRARIYVYREYGKDRHWVMTSSRIFSFTRNDPF